MRRYVLTFTFLIILISFISVFLYVQRDAFLQSPFSRELALTDVSYATTDEYGYLYVIHNEKRQLLKLNSSGVVQFEYEPFDNKQRFQYERAVVDKHGRLYVLQTNFAPYSENIDSESIVRYDTNGNVDAVIFSVEHEGNEQMEQTIHSLQLYRDQIQFLTKVNREVFLNTYYPTSEKLETSSAFRLPEHAAAYEIVGGTSSPFVFSTKRGELYKADENGTKLLYKNERGGIGRGVLERLSSGLKDDLYFFDRHRKEIIRFLLADGSEHVFLNKEIVGTQGYSFSFTHVGHIFNGYDDETVVTEPNRITLVDSSGKIEAVYERALYSQEARFLRMFIWLSPVLLLSLCLYALRFMYIYLLDRKVSLLIKQLFLFLSLFLLAVGGLSYVVYDDFAKKIVTEAKSKRDSFANVLEASISAVHLEQITAPNDYRNDAYLALESELKKLPPEVDGAIYKFENGQSYVLFDEKESFFAPIVLPAQDSDRSEDDSLMTIRTLFHRSGDEIGQLKLTVNEQQLEKKRDEWRALIVKYNVFAILIAFVVFFAVTAWMLRPIRQLQFAVNEITKGKWETAVSIASSDEVAELGKQLNKMTDSVSQYSKKMTDLNEAYYRFIPQLFLQYLGKETVLDLQLGDHTEQEKTIVIFKMRSFYSFSKHLTLEENFKFINSFLSRFSPIIKQNQGLVNKYLGAGALSFFPYDATFAVQSAIEMRKELVTYNYHRAKMDYRAIDIGIAIHKGPTMFGVIGEKERLEGAVISDEVNLAEMLEAMSESLGVSILVTQSIIDDLQGRSGARYRNLGMVSVTERDEPIPLYDVYEGDPELICQLKEETKELFEHGVILYQDGRFFDARANFLEVIKKNPHDKTAKQYFYLCDEYYQRGAPHDWNGTLLVQ